MSKTVSLIRKVIVGAIGFPILVLGLILIPVPGPGGLPVTLLGLIILSLEFDWARRRADSLRALIHSLLEKGRTKR